MPEGFDRCRRGGGRVRTISGPSKRFGLKPGQYMHVCIDDSGLHRGEVKRKAKADAIAKGKNG